MRFRFRKKKKKSNAVVLSKLNYAHLFTRILSRFFKRIERKILTTFIRRKYLDPWNARFHIQHQPLIPFSLLLEDDSLTPNPKDDDVSFCSLCDFEVNPVIQILCCCCTVDDAELFLTHSLLRLTGIANTAGLATVVLRDLITTAG